MKRLIVTADDFGRCLPINEAVEDAHRHGILTAASLMVGGAALPDAIARARALPELGVGLHVTLVDGQPVLPPAQIPDLVTADGRFRSDVARLGAKIYFNRAVQDQVRAEIRAQFEAYRATGLFLDHVDSHHHYHLHPTVFAILLELAVEYGAPAIRIPFEPPFASLRARRDRPLNRLATGLLHWRSTTKMRRQAELAGLKTNDRVFGFADSGRMDRRHVADFLNRLPDGVTELYCHPATRGWDDHPMPAEYQIVDEYHALIDSDIIDKAGHLTRTIYSQL
jgi:hopanoid biosynthesis associated protein HpnK